MHSSPATPIGAGLARTVEHVDWVLAIGRPIGDRRRGVRRRGCTVDQIVVSVGPYMFHSSPTRGDERGREVARQRFAAAERLERRLAGPPGVEQQPPRRRRRLHAR